MKFNLIYLRKNYLGVKYEIISNILSWKNH